MFEWIKADVTAVVTRVETLEKDLLAAQAMVTSLSGGYLTATNEIALLRAALASTGVQVPVVPAATVAEIAAFLAKVQAAAVVVAPAAPVPVVPTPTVTLP